MDLKHMLKKIFNKKFQQAVFRFIVYGSILVFGEIVFYNITKIGRTLPFWANWLFRYQWLVDPRLELNHIWDVPMKVLYGQASLWMFIVYGTIALFGVENAYKKLLKWNWFVRGCIYMVIILVMECAWGWILLWITGYDIWYYEGILAVFKYTSLAIAPMWFIVGLLSENIIKFVYKLDEVDV
jgi:hypothetical protein